jgi:phosphatidylinositol alpha-1,6-mannosyltransferase
MILITTQCFPPERGGIETLMGGLADALHASGREVVVFADGARNFTAPYVVKRFVGLKPLRRRIKAWAVARATRSGQVEGVFADSWKSVELLPEIAAPIAVLAHGMEFPAAASPGKRTRIARAFAKARTVIANSVYTASLAQPYLAGAARLVVINPPIPALPVPPAEAAARVRATVGGRGPVLLTLARLEPRKGIDTVIRALPSILSEHPNLLYLVAGGGDDRARLESLATETGVRANVHFAGLVDNEAKVALLAAADAFVMPTRREGDSVEGYGIVFVEAGWYGVPSIAGRDGGAVDAVQDNETGLLCDAREPSDIGRQLLRLLGDEALRKRLGAAAAARAHGEAQWTNAISRYLDALR